ncbi:MAG: serine protease [Bryobacteraceae bacterium]
MEYEFEIRDRMLRVVEPRMGSAFVAAPGIAVSCCHVVESEDRKVKMEYRSRQQEPAEWTIEAEYLPDQSDPSHDVAVARLHLPEGLDLPAMGMSLDADPGFPVGAFGFREGQYWAEEADGYVFRDPVRRVTFQFGTRMQILEVLRIDPGRLSEGRDDVFMRGMSGGPLLNPLTLTAVGIVAGLADRGVTGAYAPPEGYAISLEHLCECSSILRPHVLPAVWEKARSDYLVSRCGGNSLLRDLIVQYAIAKEPNADSERYWWYLTLGRLGGRAARAYVCLGLEEEPPHCMARLGAEQALAFARTPRLP